MGCSPSISESYREIVLLIRWIVFVGDRHIGQLSAEDAEIVCTEFCDDRVLGFDGGEIADSDHVRPAELDVQTTREALDVGTAVPGGERAIEAGHVHKNVLAVHRLDLDVLHLNRCVPIDGGDGGTDAGFLDQPIDIEIGIMDPSITDLPRADACDLLTCGRHAGPSDAHQGP